MKLTKNEKIDEMLLKYMSAPEKWNKGSQRVSSPLYSLVPGYHTAEDIHYGIGKFFKGKQ